MGLFGSGGFGPITKNTLIGFALGGPLGAGLGYMIGSSQKAAQEQMERAEREQREAQAREQARRDLAVQQTRVRFGDIWNVTPFTTEDEQTLSHLQNASPPSSSHSGHIGGFIGRHIAQAQENQRAASIAALQQRRQQFEDALRNYALWSGNIERQAQQVGENLLSGGLANVYQQARMQRENLQRRGLLGSSFDRDTQLTLNQQLGNLIGGAYAVTSQQQQQAVQSLRQRQQQFEALARQGVDTSGISQAIAEQHQLAAQRSMIPATMLGNMIGAGMQFGTAAVLTNAMRPSTPNSGGPAA